MLTPQPISKDPPSFTDLNRVFDNILVIALPLFSVVLFVMILIGGFKYMTAGGDKSKVQSAQKTLTFAIIGFVFVTASYLILQLIANFTGAAVGNFDVFLP